MRILSSIFLFAVSTLSATHLFIFGEKALNSDQKMELFELILKGEPPRIFYDSHPIDLKAECYKFDPSMRLEWIPPSIWQIGVLHAFFHEPTIREGILAYCKHEWEPLEYEQVLHRHLISAHSLEEIVNCFDHHSRSLPHLCELFFQINKSLIALYHRAGGADAEMLSLVISELPPFCQWREKDFPFWKSPWIYNPCSAEIFYNGVKDINLISEVLKIERLAYENGEWVLYRGYAGLGYPSTLQLYQNNLKNRNFGKEAPQNFDSERATIANSHALSFGSTLLGGAFFSLEAAAITYSKPETPAIHSFIALRVRPQELKDLFRIGPLHPFIQLFADGEMFHAHTKIATNNSDVYKNEPLDGYFMNCNKQSIDPLGYITAPNMTPEELEKAFLLLCEKSSHIFLY